MKMKKLLINCGAAVMLGLSGSAFGFFIDDGATNVGDLDKGLYTDGVLGNPTSEAAWASEKLGFTVTASDDTKIDPAFFTQVDDSDSVIAIALLTSPGYYLIKDAQTTVLFENLASFDWAVLDLEVYFGTNKLDDSSELFLSHLTEFEGDNVTVPEPGAMGLIGLGLIGLGFFRRKIRLA